MFGKRAVNRAVSQRSLTLERGAKPRAQFLQKVADAVANCPQPGRGVVHRAAREIQRGFTLQSQKETDAAMGPIHFRARAQLL